ncbi:MAG: sulfotransferase domain-containing protein [Chloroflexota bacterium]
MLRSTLRSLYDRLPAAARGRLRALTPDAALRWYAHRRTDVYLVSYPKCGRTWLRLMIGRAVSQHYALGEAEEVLFLRSNRRFHPDVPRITVVHEDRPMLKTPDELQPSKQRFKDKRVIFLARDPRDVIVSSYFEMKNRGRMFGSNPYEKHQPVFEGSLAEFIQARRGGYATLLRYYNIWAANRTTPRGFLLVRYEDLKANPAGELRRVLDFLGLAQIGDDEIVGAVDYASFENMRKMELGGRFESGMLKPADQANQESYKTRKGKVKGFVEYLSQGEIEELNQITTATLDPFFGYLADEGLTAHPASAPAGAPNHIEKDLI